MHLVLAFVWGPLHEFQVMEEMEIIVLSQAYYQICITFFLSRHKILDSKEGQAKKK